MLYAIALLYALSLGILLTDLDVDNAGWLFMTGYHIGVIGLVIWVKRVGFAKILAVNLLILALAFPIASELYRSVQHYDFRTKAEIVSDLRESDDQNAGPALLPTMFIAHDDSRGADNIIETLPAIDGEKIFPLSGLPYRANVYCQEDEGWFTFQSDRYGFNNPDAVWDAEDNIILLLGDSFTQGACTHQNIAYHLRQNTEHPIINLGNGGAGPLIQYAQFREFTDYKKPKRVYWLIAANDVTRVKEKILDIDFVRELKSDFLSQYLNLDHSQNYFARYADLLPSYESTISPLIDKQIAHQSNRLMIWPQILSGSYTLKIFRNLMHSQAVPDVSWRHISPSDQDKLNTLYQNTKQLMEQHNISVTFIILPHITGCHLQKRPEFYDDLTGMYDQLGFDYIDMWDHFYNECHNYFAKNGGHMNGNGYAYVADAILKDMNENE